MRVSLRRPFEIKSNARRSVVRLTIKSTPVGFAVLQLAAADTFPASAQRTDVLHSP